MNKVYLMVSTVGAGILAALLTFETTLAQLNGYFGIGTPVAVPVQTVGIIFGVWMVAQVVLSMKIPPEAKHCNNIWRLPLRLIYAFIGIFIALIVAWPFVPFIRSFSGLFLMYNLIPLGLIIFFSIRLNQLLKALKYDYKPEDLDTAVFLEKHPEAIYKMKPDNWPISYLKKHPEVVEKLNPKELPRELK